MDDVPNRTPTCHWTGASQSLCGLLQVGKREYGFLGKTDALPMRMRSVEVKACSTTYVMESPEAALTVKFTSPLLLDDLKVLARPVTYVSLKAQGRYGRPLPACSATLLADEALCLDYAGQCPVESGEAVGKGYEAVTLSSGVQQPLNRSGDDVRIDWGRLYLAVEPAGTTSVREENGRTAIQAQIPLEEGKEVLFALAYDEVFAIQYFGQNLEPYWKKERETLSGLLELSFRGVPGDRPPVRGISPRQLEAEATEAGGGQYAELLLTAYRQVIGAHTLCEDPEGKLLFISKECFSNGCAATADVSYPPSPCSCGTAPSWSLA